MPRFQLVSLFGQHSNGIDPQGAPCRHHTCSERDDSQQHGYTSDDERIQGPNPVNLVGHYFLQRGRTAESHEQPDCHEQQGFAEHEFHDTRSSTAESHPDANFAPALRNQVRKNSLNADRRKEQSEATKRQRQHQ